MLLYFLINYSLKNSGAIFLIDDFTNVTFACDNGKFKFSKINGKRTKISFQFFWIKGKLKALS